MDWRDTLARRRQIGHIRAMSEAPHGIDHCVLPTADLATARDRLSALGFTVAPNGAHPFGTENCCVYFADGTFLEPLAVADQVAAREAFHSHNVFVARDSAYRLANGEEGFSALAFSTGDAEADDKAYREQGFSAGPMLSFERPMVDAAGKRGTAGFRLAFAGDPAAPDALFFACERVRVPKVDRAHLQLHANGAYAIRGVVASAPEPHDFAALVLAAAGASYASAGDRGLDMPLARGTVTIAREDTLEKRFGVRPRKGSGLRLQAVRLAVADLGLVEALLAENAVRFARHGSHIVVQPARGQGAAFIFEDEA